MNRVGFILGVILGFCLMGQSSWATKAYVTDSLKVTLRTRPSTESKIIAVLSSGQPIEVLDSQGDWSLVRLLERGETKKEGWMLSQYLITRLPWKMQVRSLKEENIWLKQKVPTIETKLSETTRREEELTVRLQERVEALNRLQKEYESLKQGASGYLNLKTTHSVTRSMLESMKKDVQRLTAENEALRSSEKNKWFAIGALVVLCGLMIGLVVGRQHKRRRSLYY